MPTRGVTAQRRQAPDAGHPEGPALAWYGAIVLRLPGSGDYLLDQQVVGRLLSSHLERNAGWSGAIRVYFPTLLVGLAPWALYATRHLWSSLPRAWQERLAGTPRGQVELLLVLWTFLPLGVFFAASSWLPLFVLPLAAPVAVLAHLALGAGSPAPGDRRQALTRGPRGLPRFARHGRGAGGHLATLHPSGRLDRRESQRAVALSPRR